MDQVLNGESNQLPLDEEFYNIFSQDNLEIASVDKDNQGNAKKMDKSAFQEQTYHKIKQKQLAMMLKDLEWDDRYEWLNYMKSKAANLVRQQEYDRAIQIYMEASVGLDLSQKDQQRNEIMKSQFQTIILSNLAICFKKKKDFERAIKFHNYAIQMEPNNPIQLLKRSYTYLEMGEIQFAINDIQQCQQLLNAQPNPEIYNELKIILQKIDEQKQKYKKACQKMFQQNGAHQNKKEIISSTEGKINQIEKEDTISSKQKQNNFGAIVNIYNKSIDILKKLFGCKRIFDYIDEDEVTDEMINEDYRSDQTSNFLF